MRWISVLLESVGIEGPSGWGPSFEPGGESWGPLIDPSGIWGPAIEPRG